MAERAGTLCSNPNCCALTFGPRTEIDKSVNIGVAAHIEGAARLAPRYNPKQTPEERSSIENGIWLCQTCAKLVDNDEKKYTVSLLKHWKEQAEQRAKRALENPKLVSFSFLEAQSLVVVSRQKKTTPPKVENFEGRPPLKITMRPLKTPHDSVDIRIPFIIDAKLLEPGQVLYFLLYQNVGKQIDEKVNIKVSFQHSSICKLIIDQQQRMLILEGGKLNSSFVSLYIPETLPNEVQSVKLIASSDEIPEISFWTKQAGYSSEVFILDCIYETN